MVLDDQFQIGGVKHVQQDEGEDARVLLKVLSMLYPHLQDR